MAGSTEIDPVPSFRSITDFQSAYLLAGYYFGDFRIAGRVDVFATQVENQPGGSGPGEYGRALTVSGSWNPVRWMRLVAEVMHVDSSNGARASAGLSPRASESQVQFVTRIAF
ncbi:MAG: hypothetical protein WA459_14515 [Stellaceae bacterium]